MGVCAIEGSANQGYPSAGVPPDCRPCWNANVWVDQWGSGPYGTLTGDMINLANPDDAGYDEELLVAINSKLNALKPDEIGKDKILFEP